MSKQKNKSYSSEGVFLTTEGEVQAPASKRIPAIVGIFIFFLAVGLLNLYSASLGEKYFSAQLYRMAPGLILFVFCGWLLPIRVIQSYSYWIYGITVGSLLVVLLLGYSAGGSQRWINLGFFAVQPSELAKISVAIVVAKFFQSSRLNTAYQLKDLWPVMLTTGLIFALIFKQPDLGTAGICLIIAVTQILFMKIDLRSVSIVGCSAIIVAALGWNFFLHDYQKLRILNLLNPDLDPHGSGYNSIQSLVAIGSGNFVGKGFLQGTQAQLQFLPARHTDFIFSVFAEEWGFWAGTIVFFLFGLLTYLILEVARHAQSTFSSLLAIGIAALIFVEFTINVAMVLGMFPVVGMPLPFFSYGGSSLLTMCIAMGILVAIDRQTASAKRMGGHDELSLTGLSFRRRNH